MKQKYVKIPLSEYKANNLVKKVLIDLGYSENIEIRRFIGDNNKLSYFVYGTICYQGKETKILSQLNYHYYIECLKMAINNNDSEVKDIYPNIGVDKVIYNITTVNKEKRKVR